jgi:tetratricopeptide (TPR) repeat protein
MMLVSCVTTDRWNKEDNVPLSDYARSLLEYRQSLEDVAAGNHQKAELSLRAALDLLSHYTNEKKDLSFLHMELAECLVRLDRYDSARSNFERAIALDKTNSRSLLRYGDFFRNAGKLDQALQVYRTGNELHPDNPDFTFGMASIYDMRGDLVNAQSNYRKTLLRKPDHLEASFNLMNLHIKARQYGVAIALFESFPKSVQENDYLLFEFAYCLKKTGAFQRSMEILTEVLDRGKTDPYLVLQELIETHYFLGNSEKVLMYVDAIREFGRLNYFYDELQKEIRSENIQKSLAFFNQVIAYDNMNLLAHVARYRTIVKMMDGRKSAEAAIQVGRVALAERNLTVSSQYFALAKSHQPNSVFPYTLMAMLYEEAGQLDQSVKEIESALKIQPTSSTLFQYLGNLRQQQGQYKDSYAAFQKAYRLDDKDVGLIVKLGYVAGLVGKTEESLRYFLKAAEMSPTEPDILILPALGYLQQSNYRAALPFLRKLEQMGSDADNLYYYLGICYEKTGELQLAIAALEKAIELQPEYADALNYLAYMLIDSRTDVDRGLALVGKALEMEPGNPTFLDTLGWGLYRKGDYAAALEKLLESARIFADQGIKEAEVFDHLGDTYLALREEKQALTYWQMALSLVPKEDRIRKKTESLKQKLKAGK